MEAPARAGACKRRLLTLSLQPRGAHSRQTRPRCQAGRRQGATCPGCPPACPAPAPCQPPDKRPELRRQVYPAVCPGFKLLLHSGRQQLTGRGPCARATAPAGQTQRTDHQDAAHRPTPGLAQNHPSPRLQVMETGEACTLRPRSRRDALACSFGRSRRGLGPSSTQGRAPPAAQPGPCPLQETLGPWDTPRGWLLGVRGRKALIQPGCL